MWPNDEHVDPFSTTLSSFESPVAAFFITIIQCKLVSLLVNFTNNRQFIHKTRAHQAYLVNGCQP